MNRSSPLTVAPELLDVRQVAQLLNVGRNRVYELVKARQLPHVVIGQRLRFPRTAVLRWIDDQVRP